MTIQLKTLKLQWEISLCSALARSKSFESAFLSLKDLANKMVEVYKQRDLKKISKSKPSLREAILEIFYTSSVLFSSGEKAVPFTS